MRNIIKITEKVKVCLTFLVSNGKLAHKIISKKKFEKSKILEVGAGTLNHLKYEKSFSEYDIVEPFKKTF